MSIPWRDVREKNMVYAHQATVGSIRPDKSIEIKMNLNMKALN